MDGWMDGWMDTGRYVLVPFLDQRLHQHCITVSGLVVGTDTGDEQRFSKEEGRESMRTYGEREAVQPRYGLSSSSGSGSSTRLLCCAGNTHDITENRQRNK